MSESALLVGDIGGTNARFALAKRRQRGFVLERTLRCDEYLSAYDAIAAYIADVGVKRLETICLAAAGPVVGGSVDLTNNHWKLDAAELQKRFSPRGVRLLNDFEAVACSIPALAAGDSLAIGGPPLEALGDRDFVVGIIGPGTGLGAAGLLRREGRLYPIVSEAGHTDFAPQSKLQREVAAILRTKFPIVSVERLVSGGGLENLYDAVCRLRGKTPSALSAAKVFSGAQEHDEDAATAVQLFFEVLGQVAGNVALTLGAFDGVFVAGGIAQRYPEQLAASRFRAAFEKRDSYGSLMTSIPTRLITVAEPGLLGASEGVRQMMSAQPNGDAG